MIQAWSKPSRKARLKEAIGERRKRIKETWVPALEGHRRDVEEGCNYAAGKKIMGKRKRTTTDRAGNKEKASSLRGGLIIGGEMQVEEASKKGNVRLYPGSRKIRWSRSFQGGQQFAKIQR